MVFYAISGDFKWERFSEEYFLNGKTILKITFTVYSMTTRKRVFLSLRLITQNWPQASYGISS